MIQRDLSFIETEGLNVAPKMLRNLKSMDENSFHKYKLRLLISQCLKQGNVERSAALYRDAKEKLIVPSPDVCANVINLLCGLGEPGNGSKRKRDKCSTDMSQSPSDEYIDTAFVVFHDMKAHKLPINEACYTALIRGLCGNGRCREASYLLEELQDTSNNEIPRHRSFSPFFLAYSKSQISSKEDFDHALQIFETMTQKYKMIPSEIDYSCMLLLCNKQNSLYFYDILEKYIDDLFIPHESTIEIILDWFRNREGKERGEKFDVFLSSVSPDGIVEKLGIQLESISLKDSNRQELKLQIEKMCLQKDSSGDLWNDFLRWIVENEGKFDCVIDGANVGFYKTNYVGAPKTIEYQQIDWIVHQLRSEGYNPLVVLHCRHLENKKLSSAYTDIISAWKNKKIVYATPHGCNDDWYWLYIAVHWNCSLVITNDIMRDHHFGLLSPRWFGRWRERHQCYFNFGAWECTEKRRKVIFSKPLSYSHRSQKIEDSDRVNLGFYFPLSTYDEGNNWWCVVRK
jgi:proteinaceous RNase P